jgi:hypothetical protein
MVESDLIVAVNTNYGGYVLEGPRRMLVVNAIAKRELEVK